MMLFLDLHVRIASIRLYFPRTNFYVWLIPQSHAQYIRNDFRDVLRSSGHDGAGNRYRDSPKAFTRVVSKYRGSS